MTAPTITIVDANLEYEKHLLFQQINLALPGGEWTCLLGPSGVGKSSLLRLIGGLKTDAYSSNPLQISDNRPLTGRIAYLAQNEKLLPWLDALQNVYIGRKLRGEKCDAPVIDRAKGYLSKVGLEKYFNYLPAKLSGGMKQRVLLARTLLEDKPVILMDEPFAALDAITRTNIQELAFELLQGRTVLLVTHDPMEAVRLGHNVLVISGKPANISPVKLSGIPLRELSNPDLLRAHAEILDKLSHSREVVEC